MGEAAQDDEGVCGLPPLILLHIARHLRRSDTLRLRLVCRQWRDATTAAVDTLTFSANTPDHDLHALKTIKPSIIKLALPSNPSAWDARWVLQWASLHSLAGLSVQGSMSTLTSSVDLPDLPRLQRLSVSPHASPAGVHGLAQLLSLLPISAPKLKALDLRPQAAAGRQRPAPQSEAHPLLPWPMVAFHSLPLTTNSSSDPSNISLEPLSALGHLTELHVGSLSARPGVLAKAVQPGPAQHSRSKVAPSVTPAVGPEQLDVALACGAGAGTWQSIIGTGSSPASSLSLLTQLVTLELAGECDLGTLSHSLAALTQLRSLSLPHLFATDIGQLESCLAPLTLLTSLTLGFGSEYWVTLRDLGGVLGRLPQLGHLGVSIDYGMPDELDDELGDEGGREELLRQEDWCDLVPRLTSLTSLDLNLANSAGTQLGKALEQRRALSRRQPTQQGKEEPTVPQPRHLLRRVAVSLSNPGTWSGTARSGVFTSLQPACEAITELRLGGTEGGVLLSPADCACIAQLNGLRVLSLTCAVISGCQEGQAAWPSMAEEFALLHKLQPACQGADSAPSSPGDETNHGLLQSRIPGNPLLLLAACRQLQRLTVEVGRLRGVLPGGGGDSDNGSAGPVAGWAQGITASDSDEEGSAAEGAAPGGSAGSPYKPLPHHYHLLSDRAEARVMSKYLQQYVAALIDSPSMDAAQAGAGASSSGPGTCSPQDWVLLEATGLCDTVVSTWVAHMPCLTHLNLSGWGWLSSGTEQGGPCKAQETHAPASGLLAVGQHCTGLQSLSLALSGPEPVRHSTTNNQHPCTSTSLTAAAEAEASAAAPGVHIPAGARPPRDSSSSSSYQAPGSVTGTSFDFPYSQRSSSVLARPWLNMSNKTQLTTSGNAATAQHTAGSSASTTLRLPPQRFLTIRPSHLPPTLSHLELHDVRFSQEFEDPSLPVPRLASLYLSSTGGCRVLLPADTTAGAAVAPETSRPGGQLATNNAAGLAASSDQPAGPQKGTTAATEVVAPTLISNWHFLHIISRQATLSHLSLHDTAEEPGGAWRELPSRAKLRARALSLLSHLRELTSLDLQVGHRMDWGAQEVLCSQVLPSLSCLRMLRLGASNLYLEALEPLTRLSPHLRSLYLESSYQVAPDQLSGFVQGPLQAALPNCRISL